MAIENNSPPGALSSAEFEEERHVGAAPVFRALILLVGVIVASCLYLYLTRPATPAGVPNPEEMPGVIEPQAHDGMKPESLMEKRGKGRNSLAIKRLPSGE